MVKESVCPNEIGVDVNSPNKVENVKTIFIIYSAKAHKRTRWNNIDRCGEIDCINLIRRQMTEMWKLNSGKQNKTVISKIISINNIK